MKFKTLKDYIELCEANGVIPTWEGLNQFKNLLKSHKAA